MFWAFLFQDTIIKVEYMNMEARDKAEKEARLRQKLEEIKRKHNEVGG